MYKHFSPLVVFTYLRFNKLKKLINKLKSNKISKQTEIIFFSDFAKDKSELEKVKRVRNYLFKINGRHSDLFKFFVIKIFNSNDL